MSVSQGSPHAGQEEDRIDRWFNRKLAWPIAVLCARLGIHPNTVSVIGMLFGVAAGYFYQFHDLATFWPGAVLLVICTIIDNADGMVARLTGKSSEMGYVIDGICDNLVFFSIYSFAMYGGWFLETPLGGTYGPWILLLGLLSGISHSRQSAMLDFYKMQWRYFAVGLDSYAFKPHAEVAAQHAKAAGNERWILRLRMNHAALQEKLSPARQILMPVLSSFRSKPGFPDRYAELNWLPMKGWFFLGPNWHIIFTIGCGLLGRMDLYFASQLILFNLVLVLTLKAQARRDEQLVAEMGQGA